MRGALVISVALHALAAAWLFVPPIAPWPAPHEVEARIEVVFGHAPVSGTPVTQAAPKVTAAAAAPAPTPIKAPPVKAAPTTPVPNQAVPSQAEKPTPDQHATATVSTSPAATQTKPAPASAALSVHLDAGDLGFDISRLDPGITEAQDDPGNRPPGYPRDAAEHHEHGSVLLRIHVGTDGRVAGVETLQSSGFPELDDAARDAALRWKFIPQLRDGAPVPSVRDQNFDFVLQ